jgi:hypothetical protein
MSIERALALADAARRRTLGFAVRIVHPSDV